MIKIFELYLIKLFLRKITYISVIFFILIFILNLFEEISFFKSSNVNVFYPILIGLLNVPSTLLEIFPFIFLIATQFFFLEIINKDELEILKVNGLSNLKILKTLILTSLILGVLLATLFYNLSSKLKFVYTDIKNTFSNDNKYLAVVKESGLWIKDEIDDKILIITSDNILSNKLIQVSIYELDQNFNLSKIIQSDEVDISNYEWRISNPITFQDNQNKKLDDILLMTTHFNLDKINSMFNNLSTLGIGQLLKLKKDYKSLKYSTTEIDVHLHKIYSLPLFVTIITILTSIIMFNNKKNKSMIFHLILGVLMSVIIYYLYYLFNLLGENGKMPIIISIYLPFITLFLLALIGLVNLNEK
ncbi:LptF/LptG family permease [Candidatus Pelagibacter sp. Uisw_092]|uniref:LptF/LptG family permease n=1 Tax=Candidatus Pelagibacter sp. Uisw_092 TaxID=3230979 RepID=UPI0039E7C669